MKRLFLASYFAALALAAGATYAQEAAPQQPEAPAQLNACGQKVTEEVYDAIRQRARADAAERRAADAEARLKALTPSKEKK